MSHEQQTDAATALQALHVAYRAYMEANDKARTLKEESRAFNARANAPSMSFDHYQVQSRNDEAVNRYRQSLHAAQAAIKAQRRVWDALHAYMELQEASDE